MNLTKKRRVSITVDVEAHPIRAARDHVQKLIWGRQNGREAGIGAMMDIADKHNATLTFFLDYPEYELYGEELLDVGREIHRRGHDLQLHCHAEYITPKLLGIDDPWQYLPDRLNLGQSLKVVDWLLEKQTRITGQSALAYRSGAYHIAPDFLDALADRGVKLDSSYNLAAPDNILKFGIRKPFIWKNGVMELPIPLIPYFQRLGHLVPWNFNASCFTKSTPDANVAVHRHWLESWFKRHGQTSLPNMLMHSWSFWRQDEKGFFTIPDDNSLETFDRLLEMLAREFEVAPIAALAREGVGNNLECVDQLGSSGHCPVCFEPTDHFEDYNGGKKRHCPFCHSVERQRTLVDLVYSGAFGPHVFTGKDILHIAPGWPETLLLRRIPECRVMSINILPGANIQGDIQNMPEIPDNSFDIVLASEVFRHVRDLRRALLEINRILRPGGLLLCSDCLDNADFGREVTDLAEQASWYGMEKLEQYGIGDFRRFGRLDWEKTFQPFFYTRLFKATDNATGTPAWWLACAPKKAINTCVK